VLAGLRRRSIALPRPLRSANLFDREVGDDRSRRQLGDVDVGIRELIAMLEQEPLVPLAPRPSFDFHQRPLAEHLLPEHLERELARPDPFDRIFRLGELPRAAVPDDDVAAAVVAGRDDSLERRVVVRMVLGHHRQALDRRIVGRPFRHRPRFQNALHLQPEVVVKMRRGMLLDDEDRQLRLLRLSARRLRRIAEVAHGFVFLE